MAVRREEAKARGPIVARPGGYLLTVLLAIGVWAFGVAAVLPPIAAAAGALGVVALVPFALGAVAIGVVAGATTSRVRLGKDGLEMRWLGRTRFVRFRDVAALEIDAKRIGIRTTRGEWHYVAFPGATSRSDADPRHLEWTHRLELAVQAAKRDREVHALEEELARGTRSVAEHASAIA